MLPDLAFPELLRVLRVADSVDPEARVVAALAPMGRPLSIERVQGAEPMRAALSSPSGRWHVVLSDWSMSGFSGLEAM